VITFIVVLNILLGCLYLNWRVFRGMNAAKDWRQWATIGSNFVDPDDPENDWTPLEELKVNWLSWLLLFGEVSQHVPDYHRVCSQSLAWCRGPCSSDARAETCPLSVPSGDAHDRRLVEPRLATLPAQTVGQSWRNAECQPSPRNGAVGR
jgi:hypothetical protein